MNVFTEPPNKSAADPADPKNKRHAQKAATARKVLLAARDAFERDGFEGASVRGIARDADVAVGTVLKHYGDKRQLLFAALHEALDEALEVAARAVGEARDSASSARGNVVDRLLGIAESVFEVYRARPRLGRTLLREALFADGAWGARFVQQTGRAHALVASVVRDAVTSDELPPETDAEELGLAFLSFFYFALVSWAQGAPLPFGPLGLIERLLVGRLGVAPTRSRRGAARVEGPKEPSSVRATATQATGKSAKPKNAKTKNAKKNAKTKNATAKRATAKRAPVKDAKAKNTPAKKATAKRARATRATRKTRGHRGEEEG